MPTNSRPRRNILPGSDQFLNVQLCVLDCPSTGSRSDIPTLIEARVCASYARLNEPAAAMILAHGLGRRVEAAATGGANTLGKGRLPDGWWVVWSALSCQTALTLFGRFWYQSASVSRKKSVRKCNAQANANSCRIL